MGKQGRVWRSSLLAPRQSAFWLMLPLPVLCPIEASEGPGIGKASDHLSVGVSRSRRDELGGARLVSPGRVSLWEFPGPRKAHGPRGHSEAGVGQVQSRVFFGNCYALAGLGTLNLSTSGDTSSHTACACLLPLPLGPLSRWLHLIAERREWGLLRGHLCQLCLCGLRESVEGGECPFLHPAPLQPLSCICLHSCTSHPTAISASAPRPQRHLLLPGLSPRPCLRM